MRLAGVPIENTHPSLITDGVAAEDQQMAVSRPFWVFFVLNIGIAPWLSGVIVAEMGLNLFQAAVVIVIGSALGAALPATTALLGPQSGLSQLEVGRFAFGRVGNRLPAILNWIGAIGWDVIFNSLSAAAVVSLLGRYVRGAAMAGVRRSRRPPAFRRRLGASPDPKSGAVDRRRAGGRVHRDRSPGGCEEWPSGRERP